VIWFLLPPLCIEMYSTACYVAVYHSTVQYNIVYYTKICGPGTSVGIATDYGLDGLESNPGGQEIFRPCRPVLGPTQPPVKWAPGLSRR